MTSKPFLLRSAGTQCSNAVLEIEGYCYDASFPIDWNRWQSCELDNDEIIISPAPVLPDCDDFPDSVPRTADCLPDACEDASECRDAYGCDHGPAGFGYGRSGRGRCLPCSDDSECLETETCAQGLCVLRANAECVRDEDCEEGTTCHPSESPSQGRGNESVTLRCVADD
jgi:hypothetical protein